MRLPDERAERLEGSPMDREFGNLAVGGGPPIVAEEPPYFLRAIVLYQKRR